MTESALRRVLRSARPLRRRLALGVLLGALAVGAGVALLATSGYLISKASLRPPILSLTVAIVAVRFFGISRGVFRYLERLASHDAALRLLARLRVAFFERLEPLVPDGLGPQARSGDLLSRFVGDVDALQHLFVRALGPPLVALAVGGGAVATALVFEPPAALVLAAALLVAAIAVPLASARIVRQSGRREAPARAALTAGVLDLLEAGPEAVVAGWQEEALARAAAADEALRRLRRRSALTEALGDGLVTLVAGLALAGVVWVAAPAVHAGRLDGVLLGMLALLALASFEAVRPLPVAAQHLGATAAAAERLYEVVDRDPVVADPPAPAPAPAGRELCFASVTLRREGRSTPVLEGVDLVVGAGRSVALVGPSGAGKTTLAHLAVRFLDPTGGCVLLDGRDLRDYQQEDVRAAVLLSDQDARLFATSVRENLRIARPGARDDELRQALSRARALDWVDSLPDGLDTHVGEQGLLVSGGQRQRIALARAFLSPARLIVFDEPAAHLDAETAEEIVDTILDLAADGRGVLLISHSPYGLDRVDEVVRLEAGRALRASAA
ncbi:MAG TPA: thiol reductant ABC exporter subunit CydC [Gaiellaceae bacterium]|nr:thiol reductant ABC exporter subunit CydC [Gaiellaceae bacterium]